MVYAACVCLVLSFILFEVLDIDGSDFPAPLKRTVAIVKLADPPPHDLKRGYAEPVLQSRVSILPRLEPLKRDGILWHAGHASASSVAHHGRDRSTLPRASLPDPTPLV